MMKSVVAACLIASASAFAPASQKASTTALKVFENEVGAVPPLGYFDPLGLTKDGNQERFDSLRHFELKHGRVAMLAVVGYLTTAAGIRFPGAEDIPGGFAALTAIPIQVWLQMVFTWGVMEAFNRDASDIWDIPPSEFAGDYRNGFLDFGWDKQTDEWKLKKRNIEINNGRAAQMGIAGLMFHDYYGNIDEVLPY